MAKSKLLFQPGEDWNPDMLDRIWREIEIIAKEMETSYYEPQFEIISSDQMLEAYVTTGMPMMYKHWSFGQSAIAQKQDYESGRMGLAYELIINSEPCIAYLMESNNALMQTLVMAHACVSDDTEYLSPTGWKKISDYERGTPVAQYNKDGTVEFVVPSAYIVNPGKQDLLYIKGRSVESLVTGNHRVIYKNPKGTLCEIYADDLKKLHEDKTRGFQGRFITGFDIKRDSFLNLTDDEIRLHIAFKADGSQQKKVEGSDHFNSVDHYTYRFHLKKERKIRRLELLLQHMNIEYVKKSTYEGRVSIRFKYPSKIEKRFTQDWYNASPRQLKLIGDEVLYWDGSIPNEVSGNFSSEFKTDVDYIQYVWASIGRHTRIDEGTRCFNVSYSLIPLAGISDRKRIRPIETIECLVSYCFTVPSGMFVSRYNDTISVTGNSVGHSAVYKNNVYFRENTDATSIIPYLDFAKKFISKCEAEHGIDAVERVLDACHAIQIYGVDKYRRKGVRSPKRLTDKADDFDLLQHTLIDQLKDKEAGIGRDPGYMEPEENILYFIEKRAPNLEPWQREIVRIVRKISQYFLPQRQMQIVHEGYASFTHYYIMHRLYDKGLISDGSMLEFYASHSGVLTQYSYKHTTQLNPYRFGFKMFMDIKKKAEEAGKHWQTEVNYAMQNFNDESFIAQYLSLEVAQDFGLFGTSMHNDEDILEVKEIPRNGRMLDELKIRLSRQHSLSYRVPDIQVVGVDVEGDRTLFLEHFTSKDETRKLDSLDALYTLAAIKSLWGHRVRLISPDLREKDTEYEKIDDTAAIEKGTRTVSGHIGELRGRPFLEA